MIALFYSSAIMNSSEEHVFYGIMPSPESTTLVAVVAERQGGTDGWHGTERNGTFSDPAFKSLQMKMSQKRSKHATSRAGVMTINCVEYRLIPASPLPANSIRET